MSNANGATYQWLDCNNAYSPIINATYQSFTPDKGGEYAVKVSQNGCIDTSICIMSTVGINHYIFNDGITIYPNPASDVLTFNSHSSLINSIEIYNALGEKVYSDVIMQKSACSINISAFAKGVYVVKVRTDKGLEVEKIINE